MELTYYFIFIEFGSIFVFLISNFNKQFKYYEKSTYSGIILFTAFIYGSK